MIAPSDEKEWQQKWLKRRNGRGMKARGKRKRQKKKKKKKGKGQWPPGVCELNPDSIPSG